MERKDLVCNEGFWHAAGKCSGHVTSTLTVFYNIFHIYVLMVSKVIPTDHCALLRHRRVNCAKNGAYRWRCSCTRKRKTEKRYEITLWYTFCDKHSVPSL